MNLKLINYHYFVQIKLFEIFFFNFIVNLIEQFHFNFINII